MNAHVQTERLVLGDIDEFAGCVGYQAWFVSEGWLDLQTAVDNMQRLAELWGLVHDVGQDQVQAVMAEAFMPAPELPSDYAEQLIKRWELVDPRDRWKWTGELPPRPEAPPAPRLRPVSQATIDAFQYVLSLGDPDRLRSWLRDHANVANALISEAA